MSTRALIKIEGGAAAIYKHSDGYPDGVLPELTKFRDAFWKQRGYDEHYFLAQYLRWLALAEEPEMEKFEQEHGPQNSYRFLGYGIVPVNADAGQEYEYHVKKDGRIIVYAVDIRTGRKKKIDEV